MVIFGCLRLSRQTRSALQLGLDQTGKDKHFTLSNSNTELFPYSISLLCYSVAKIKGGHKRFLQNSGSSPELSAVPRPDVEKKHFPHIKATREGSIQEIRPRSHQNPTSIALVLTSPPTHSPAARRSLS